MTSMGCIGQDPYKVGYYLGPRDGEKRSSVNLLSLLKTCFMYMILPLC